MKRILAWLPAIAWAGIIFLASAQPKESFERLGLAGELVSILGHLISYGVLMFLLVVAFYFGSRVPTKFLFLSAMVIVALYGLSDEYHQSFVAGRTATLWDWLVDLLGAAVVWLLLFWRRFPGR